MEERSIETISLDGGWLCLDFVNTVHSRTVEEPFEYLPGYEELLDWSVKLEIVSPSERKALETAARDNQTEADQALAHLIEAREVLYNFFLAIARNKTPDDHIQIKFNSLLSETMSRLGLRVAANLEVQQHWKHSSDDLLYPLYPIVKSAYDLLTMDRADRVKECGACGWLFLDQSKNKSRKWCSMESCGSNVKAKRYYHRNKKKSGK